MLLMTRRFAEPAWNGEAQATAWTPSCDVLEDKDEVRIVLELPGVRPEDLKINLENLILTVRGEKKAVADQKGERWYRYERTYGSFERSFTLPVTVDPDRIQATVEHGVLTLTLPKAATAKPREIPVKVQG